MKTENGYENREKWINAIFLLDAKRMIDSLRYINSNFEVLWKKGVDIYQIKNRYIDLIFLNLAKVCDTTRKKIKKETGETYTELNKRYPELYEIFNERDKRIAHNDVDYIPSENITFYPSQLQKLLDFTLTFSKEELPDGIFFTPVWHDSTLYRLLNPNENIKNGPSRIFHISDTEEFDPLKTPCIQSILEIKRDTEFSESAFMMKAAINEAEFIQNNEEAFLIAGFLGDYDKWLLE